MSYENAKLMNLEDGQLLLSVLDKRKADIISVSDTTAEAVKTFSDGADGMPMSVTVGIEPVQDLHGYDHPWPAGGGKNLYNPDEAVQNKWLNSDNGEVVDASGYWVTGFIPVVPGGTYTKTDMGSSRSCGYDASKQFVSSIPWTGSSKQIPEGVYFVRCTGKTETIAYNGQVQIESGSTATDWVPYSNVCPISGWTGAEVTRTGKNLLHQNLVQATTKQVTLNGSIIETGDNKVWLKGGVTYTISFKRPTSKQFGLYCSGDNTAAQTLIQAHLTTTSVQFTPAKSDYFIFWVYHTSGLSTTDVSDAMIEIGSTATEYTPFVAKDTYQIAFPSSAGTVYGGTLTVNADGTGALVVDKAKCTYGSEVVSGEVVATTTGCRADIPCVTTDINYLKWSVQSGAKPIFSHYGGNVSKGYSAAQYTLFFDKVYTKQEINQMLGGMESVYKLATPQTYTLTDLDLVETLKGMNNLWADTGDIKAVDYPADTKLYIDGKVAELQALILENISNS